MTKRTTPTSWLDRVLAQPAFGVQLDQAFELDHTAAERLAPLLDAWIQQGHLGQLESTNPQGIQGVRLMSRGVSVHVGSQGGIAISAADVGIVEEVAGHRQRLRYETEEPERFSDGCERLLSLTDEILPFCFDSKRQRKLLRVSVVATCNLERDALPPGVDKLIAHIGSPWGTAPSVCDATVLVSLATGADSEERCHHKLEYSDLERPGIVKLRLDWQRVFLSHAPFLPAKVAGLWRDAMSDALVYFGRLASGELSYGDS